MYEFHDTQPRDMPSNDSLPIEAMTIDGVTIEQLIPEYRTLKVTGRELLGNTLTKLKVGSQDGERLQKRSRPVRTITVRYQVTATSPQRFREIYYQLNEILNGENKKISFADDPDKYFIGTLSDVDTPEGGKLSVVSSFTFTCFDPYAYAAKEDKFTFSDRLTSKQIDFSFRNKVAGKTRPVAHAIYKGFTTGDGASQNPSYYKQELTQLEYSRLNANDGALVSSDVLNNFESRLDNFKTTWNYNGSLDTAKIENGMLKVTGWYADNSSAWRKNTYIIITSEDWTVEFDRVKVDLVDRPDVHNARPEIIGSGKSGFVGEIPYREEMGNQNLRVIFRYTDDPAGNGNYSDWTTLIYAHNLYKYQAPHLLVKFDLVAAMEQVEPGFWGKNNIVGIVERVNWLKNNVKSASFKLFGYGIYDARSYYLGVQVWKPVGGWDSTLAHSQSKPAQIEVAYKDATSLFEHVDENGCIYIDMYSKVSQIESNVLLDYLQGSLLVTMPVSNSLNVVNNGTQPVPIRFELVNHGDNGFLAISNQKQAYLFGNPSSPDGVSSQKSEMIVTTDQNNDHGLKQWTINDGVLNDWNAYPTQQGRFEDPAVIREKRWRLRNALPYAEGWGTGTGGDGSGWHGPSASITFPTGKNIKNFKARFYAQFLFANMSVHGLQQFNIWSTGRELIASVQLWKWFDGHGSVKVRIGNHWAYIDEYNPRWDNFFGQIVIQRSGNTYTVTIENVEGSGPKTKQVVSYTDTESASKLAGGMTYWKAINGGESWKVMNNDLYDFWIRKDNVESYTNIPNLLKEGDKLTVNMDDFKVTSTLNGASALKYQDIGSRPIIAKPGNNIVTFNYSGFADRPDVVAYIRRKYL